MQKNKQIKNLLLSKNRQDLPNPQSPFFWFKIINNLSKFNYFNFK
jgi:hypothetical protein